MPGTCVRWCREAGSHLELPISLASPWCCMNSCSEASLLGRTGLGGGAASAGGSAWKKEEADASEQLMAESRL